MIRRAKESFIDSKGRLFVYCAECIRGCHGKKLNRCPLKRKAEKLCQKGCFCGTLKPDLVIKSFG